MILTNKEIEQLTDIKDNGNKKQERNRAHAILLSNDNIHIDEIAKIFSVTTRSVFGWFKNFKDQGFQSLECSSGRGRKLLLNTDKHKEIIKKQIEIYPHQPKKAYVYSMEELGMKISYETFKRFLKKHSI